MRKPAPKRNANEVFCEICQDAIRYIEKIVHNGFADCGARSLMSQICERLVWAVTAWASSFFEENLETIKGQMRPDTSASPFTKSWGTAAPVRLRAES